MKPIKERVALLHEVFDKFLKDHGIYEAWYERYRLDNLFYKDNLPIEQFIEDCIVSGSPRVNTMFHSGMGVTVWHTDKIDKFIEDHKTCDISNNGRIANIDECWMHTWRNFVDVKELLGEEEE